MLAMYAGTAFIIIQVEGSLAEPLNLPRWIGTLLVIILSAGFPITAILAWIFDLTPQGIKKTESFEESEGKEIIPVPSRKRLKASDLIMAFMAITIIILVWPKIFKGDAVDRLRSSGEKLSVAVMPFQNMTNDTTFNIWQEGIQGDLITSLSNIEELKVRHKDAIKSLLQSHVNSEFASISPAIAGSISRKLDADIFIYGTLKKAGTLLRVDAQLIDAKTKDVLKSFELNKPYKEEVIFSITDSLRKKVTDFLIVSKLINENPILKYESNLSGNPEVLRNFINGINAQDKGNFSEARDWYFKALGADSSFNLAAFNIENTYSSEGNHQQQIKWIMRNYNRRDQMPFTDRVYADWTYAINFEPPSEQIKYLMQLQDQDDQYPAWPYLLGFTYNYINQHDKAATELEKCLDIFHRWGKYFLEGNGAYNQLGIAYHKTGQYKKERKLYKESDKYNKDISWMIYRHAVLELSEKDTITANRYIERFKVVMKENSLSDADIAREIAYMYVDANFMNKAEEYFREVLRLEPEKPLRMNSLASFLIENDRNVNEGMELVERALKIEPDNWDFMDTKGWGLYKLGKFKESLEVLKKSIELRKPYYNYNTMLHIEEVKRAMAGQK